MATRPRPLKVLGVVESLFGKVLKGKVCAGLSAWGEGLFGKGKHFVKLFLIWLFYLHNMVKIQTFYLVFGAGSVVEAFY